MRWLVLVLLAGGCASSPVARMSHSDQYRAWSQQEPTAAKVRAQAVQPRGEGARLHIPAEHVAQLEWDPAAFADAPRLFDVEEYPVEAQPNRAPRAERSRKVRRSRRARSRRDRGFRTMGVIVRRTRASGHPVGRPGQAVGRPGQAVQRPGQAVQRPGQAVGLPGQAVGRPGQAVGRPGQAVGRPGQAVGRPGQAVGRPGQAVGLPGQAVGRPGQAVSRPGQSIGSVPNGR
ncbi:MAG: hypothetical protein AAGD14_08330 [Planctomycetota bacterium]